MQKRDFVIHCSNSLMMVCDVPLCLFGKVKIKTVKVECVCQHVIVVLNCFTSAKVILFLFLTNIS